jgi:competence ComEA-like helix-hairpin-helix protein
MYQHDVKQTKLKTALDETVVECVSFVGVNINSCSEHLLQRVAGLTATRAKAIIDYRRKNGDFHSRFDIKKVRGIGEKVFEQCAGFVRVINQNSNTDSGKTSKKKDEKYNPLDATNIHPESYAPATKIIEKAKLDVTQIGSARFKQDFFQFISKQNLDSLASELKIGLPTLNLIIESLEKGLGYDMRETKDGPIFKSGMTRLEDVQVGSQLTGLVTNVAAFGAFVDVGLGKNGLMHNSKMRGMRVELGNRVQVKLILKEPDRGKIGLELIKIL